MTKHKVVLSEELMESSAIAESNADQTPTRKELGAYYTPSNLTSILTAWAICSSSDHVLEPSFGGCGFLESAVARLTELGCQNPRHQLFGCDIDDQAFLYLSQKLGSLNNIEQRFILADFMTISPGQFLTQKFDAIIGNPPYISQHNLTGTQKGSIDTWRTHCGIKINRRASLWAYFVLHGMSFLKDHGRMAWVLPGSFLQTNYGIEMHATLLSRFGRVEAIRLGERVFLSEGTEERTVLLLCSNYGQPTDMINISDCETVADVAIRMGQGNCGVSVASQAKGEGVYQAVARKDDVVTLGELCKVLIGTVTGANRFFIMTKIQAVKRGLSTAHLKPILSKFGHIPGAKLTVNDVNFLREAGKRCLLFHVPNEVDISEMAAAYMATFPIESRKNNRTFQRRQNKWLAADDGRIPDAFFSYMTHDGPRLALNEARINATNSIHRIFFAETTNVLMRKLVVISLCTSFSQLSAEIEGRSYGSGVLKIEPSEAKKIRLILPKDRAEKDVEAVFSQLDLCLRNGDATKVQEIADQFIFGNSPSIQHEIIEPLMAELKIARRRRRRT